MIDRSNPPRINPIPDTMPIKSTIEISNSGIPIHCLSSSKYDIVRIEFVFKAGRIFETKKLASKTSLLLLKEGTKNYSANELSDIFDYYGASLTFPSNFDFCSVVLVCLSKHFQKLIPYVLDIIINPAFPELEMSTLINRLSNKLKIELEKSESISYRKITEHLFGQNHPYGYNSEKKDYGNLQRSDLMAHYQRCYIRENCTCFLTGYYTPEDLTFLSNYLSKIKSGEELKPSVSLKSSVTPVKEDHELFKNKVQSAIKVGCKLFTRTHEDYASFFLLNAFLGGHFGSRLSLLIREEKGFTYHIDSFVDTLLLDGYFMISTEVDSKHKDETVNLIFQEIKNLRENKISNKELDNAKRYISSFMLSAFDGPFKQTKILKQLTLEQCELDFYHSLLQKVKNTSAEEIAIMANKYLNDKELSLIIVS